MKDRRILITQGQHATGVDESTVISTLLGSCVSCCLWDDVARVGGMNHMLLAAGRPHSTVDTLADINEIETLINALTKLGASRDRLKAKAFGGARMVTGLSDIGAKNAEFTVQYLESEGIPVVSTSLGGTHARNVRFWPATGRALQRITDDQVPTTEVRAPATEGNDLELF